MGNRTSTSGYEPLDQVRKEFRVAWYRCPIPRDRLKELTARSDLRGAFQAVGHLVLLVTSGTVTLLAWQRGLWGLMIAAIYLHGIMYSFVPGLVTHELSHGTVFRTKWLNGLFLRIYSLLGWVNFHHYKRSHTYHHLYTLHPKGDREVVLPGNPSLKALLLVQLATFNFQRLWFVLSSTIRLAVAGVFHNEWSEAIFPESDPKGRKLAVRWARLVLLFHVAVIAGSIIGGVWPLALLVSFGMCIANWWTYLIGVTMHTGLRDNVPDFRLCCRTIRLDPFSRFLYWHMNFHTEHHMYAAVPCYRLKELSREIAWDMPKSRTLIEAWKEMRYVLKRQKSDPSFQFDTPLPNQPDPTDGETDPRLAAGLGDLAPEGLVSDQ